MLGIPMLAHYWEAYGPFKTGHDHWTHHKACAIKVNYLKLFRTSHNGRLSFKIFQSGKLFYERWFSHSELEFKDILLKMQQVNKISKIPTFRKALFLG